MLRLKARRPASDTVILKEASSPISMDTFPLGNSNLSSKSSVSLLVVVTLYSSSSTNSWKPCQSFTTAHRLKNKSCHDTNVVNTGGTQRCHQWWQSWHHDDSRFSVRFHRICARACSGLFCDVYIISSQSNLCGLFPHTHQGYAVRSAVQIP